MIVLIRYKFIFLFLLFLFSTLFSNGQPVGNSKTNKEKPIRLLTYGLPNFKMQNAENVISAKWGIQIIGVAGCDVSEAIEDSIQKENLKAEELISKKYGKDWRTKFNSEIEDEFKLEEIAISLVAKKSYVEAKRVELIKDGNGLDYSLSIIDKKTIFNVSVCGWGKVDGKSEWVIYYKFLVDYKKKKVKLISDKIEKVKMYTLEEMLALDENK